MRVLITVASLEPEFGGPILKVRQLAAALRALGDDVIVVGAGRALDDRTLGLEMGGRFHGTPLPRHTSRVGGLVAGADVVHVVGLRDPVGTSAAWSAGRGSTPYFLEPVGMHRRRSRSPVLKWIFDKTVGESMLSHAFSVIATSSLEVSELQADGVSPDRIAKRPNGIDVSELLPLPSDGAFRKSWHIPAGVPLVVAIGRIARVKGLITLVEAAALSDHWHVAIVGPVEADGTLAAIQRTARARGCSERVHIVEGGLWGREKGSVFGAADVLAMPSAFESFGNAAAEAAAVGVPVVLTDTCGIAASLPRASTRIIPYGDARRLAKEVGEATKPHVRAAAEAAALRFRRSFEWSAIARDQRLIYEGATSGPNLAS